MIAVLGSSGLLGTRVVERLAAAGHDVLATSRKQRDGLPDGVRTAILDVRQPDTVGATLTDVDAVVIASHGLNPPGWRNGPGDVDDQGVAAIVDALAGTDTHVTFLSVIGADTDHELEFWRAKRKGELHLEQSGLPVAILRCSPYMEFHALELLGKPLKKGGRAIVVGRGDGIRNMISVDDVADLVVWVAEHRFTGRLDVVGPDNASPNDDIATIAEVLGAEPKALRVHPTFARVLAVAPGKLVPNVGRIIDISLHDDGCDQPRTPSDLPDGAPVPQRTLADVTRDHLLTDDAD